MLDTLGNIGDFVGGIAVVATLIYLAVQIRQNTNSLRTASWQAIVSGARDCNLLRTDPDTCLAWYKGMTSYPDGALEENTLFVRVMNDEAMQLQGAYALYSSRQLEERIYAPFLDWFAALTATPGGQAWWLSLGRGVLVAEMVDAVDDRVAAGNLFDIRKLPGFQVDVSLR